MSFARQYVLARTLVSPHQWSVMRVVRQALMRTSTHLFKPDTSSTINYGPWPSWISVNEWDEDARKWSGMARDEGRCTDGEPSYSKIFVITDNIEQSENLRVYPVVIAVRVESILPVLPQCSKGRKHHYSPLKVWQLCDDELNARAQWSDNHRLANGKCEHCW